MKFSFKLKKIIAISAAISVLSSSILGVSLYVGLKPTGTTVSQYNNDRKLVDYKAWAPSRIAQTHKLNDLRKKHANSNIDDFVAKEFQPIKLKDQKQDAKSTKGLQVWQYGPAIFALNQSQQALPKTATSKEVWSINMNADQTLASALNFAHYQNKTNHDFNDVLNFLGQYLAQVMPNIPEVYGLPPIEINNSGSSYTHLGFGQDSYYYSQEYSAQPVVYTDEIFWASYYSWMWDYYRPVNLSSTTLTAKNKLANTINFISAEQGMEVISFFLGAQTLSTIKKNIANIMALPVDQSPLYKEITKTKTDDKRQQTPYYSAIGNSLKEIKDLYREFLNDISIRFLENMKFAMLQALYKTITKYPLSNQELSANALTYSQPINNFQMRFKQDVYEKFKKIFTKTEYEKTTFDAIEKGDSSYPNFNSMDMNKDAIIGFDNATKKFITDSDYSPVYAFRSPKGGAIGASVDFGLYSTNFTYSPAILDPTTGVNDKGIFDEKNSVVTTGGFFNNIFSYTKKGNTSPTSFYYNQATNLDLQTVDGVQKKLPAYFILANLGLNIFVSQFTNIFAIRVQKQLDYWKTEQGKKNFESREYDPKTVDEIKDFTQFFRFNYVDFYKQSRASFSFVLAGHPNSSGQLDLTKKTTKINLDASDAAKKIKEAGGVIGVDPVVHKYSVISLANGYLYQKINDELFDNISQFAANSPKFNPKGFKKFHFSSLNEFYNIAMFYFVNLGSLRSYNFYTPFLSNLKTSLITFAINRRLGPYSISNDGLSLQQPIPTSPYVGGYQNLNFYSFLIPNMAAVLNHKLVNAGNYYSPKGTKLEIKDVLSKNSIYWKYLNAFKYNGVSLYDDNGKITKFAKNFIQTFNQEVLFSKYNFSNLSFNEKNDESAYMYGYYKKNNQLLSVENLYTKVPIAFHNFVPHINWNTNVLGYMNQVYADPDFANLKAWTAPGLSLGIYSDADLRSDRNKNAINHLKFNFQTRIQNFQGATGNTNSYSNLFAPAKFKYDERTQTQAVEVIKNYQIPSN